MHEITTEELSILIKKDSSYILIDVRSEEEVEQGRIPTSCHLPVQLVEEALDLDANAFKHLYGFPKPKKSDKIIFYCTSGSRSAIATHIALEKEYKNAINYKGSILDWIANKFKLVKS